MLVGAILWMLPVTQGVYDFRTDVKEDEFRYETGAGVTVANVTLLKELFDDDQSTVDVISDDTDDTPVVVSYHSATRLLDISGLAQSTNRTLSVSYDFDALSASGALSMLVDRVSWIWLACIIVFPPAAIVAMLISGRK
jgi:hypothetical protein